MKFISVVFSFIIGFLAFNAHAAGNCLENTSGYTIHANGGQTPAKSQESLINWKGYKVIKNKSKACFRLGRPDTLWIQIINQNNTVAKILQFKLKAKGNITGYISSRSSSSEAIPLTIQQKLYEILLENSITALQLNKDFNLNITGQFTPQGTDMYVSEAGSIILEPVERNLTNTAPTSSQKNGFNITERGGRGNCAFCVWTAAMNLRDGTALQQSDIRQKIADFIMKLPEKEVSDKLKFYHLFIKEAGETDVYQILINKNKDPESGNLRPVLSKKDLADIITGRFALWDKKVYRADEFIMDYAMRALDLQFVIYRDSGGFSCVQDQKSTHDYAVPMYFQAKIGHYQLYDFVQDNQRYEYFNRKDLVNYPKELQEFIAKFAEKCTRPEWTP